MDSYESSRDRALKKIKAAADDGDNDVLKELSNELDPKKRQEREANSQAIRMIMDKCLDNYREGEYTLPATLKMITNALGKLK